MIRLGLRFRIPYHLMLALFYVAPWWYSPGLHSRSPEAVEWSLLLFPLAAAGLLLSLIPAVRGGPEYASENGTPWSWPWFPWTAFGVLVGAVALRSYALCLAYGPVGKIWKYLPGGGRDIVFDTMWGTYFLVPLAVAVLLLLLETGLVSGHRRLQAGVLKCTPVLLLLSLPWGGRAFHDFLATFTNTVGSPVWIAVVLQAAFYAWAWVRRVSGAGLGAVSTFALLSVVGPRTLGLETLTAPHAWPLLLIGLVLLVHGLRTRSSLICAASALAAAFGLWTWLPQTLLADYRATICYHLVWLTLVTLGLTFRDWFAGVLRVVGAVLAPLAAVVVMTSARAAEVPQSWRLLYVMLLAIACFAIALQWRNRWYLLSFAGTVAVLVYASTVFGFRSAVQTLGRPAMTAFSWSVATLLLAFLISAHKAHWLPRRLIAGWPNGNGPAPPVPSDPPASPQSPS